MANELKLKLALEGGAEVNGALSATSGNISKMGQSAQAAQQHLADLSGQLAMFVGGMAGIAAVEKSISAASDFKALAGRMELLTGSAAKAADAMQSVYDIAQRQGASLMAVGDSYAKIGQAMSSLGGTSADTAHMVETVAAALRLGNASTQEADSAMRQFGQAMAKGKLNGDEFVSLMENAPYLMDAVAASLGKTKGDLFAMAEAGKLTADVFSTAVLSSFDTVTAKAATLPPTIGQAMERLTSSFTQAAGQSQVVGLASSAAMAAMGLAAEHAGQIVDKLATVAMVAVARSAILAADAFVVNKLAVWEATAANVAQLQSTLASAEAKAIYTGMVLREAQATLASTTGLGASVLAQNAVLAATVANTAATVAQTEAQAALTAATSLGSKALGLLGGPIGIITTLLGLGITAWAMWGSSAEAAENKAQAAVERSSASIIADLDNQIERINRRNALAGQKLAGVNDFNIASPAADKIGALQLQLDALEKQTGLSVEQYLTQKNKLLAEQGQLQQKLIEIEQKAAPERAAKAVRDHTDAMAKYAPVVDKATAAIEAERKALGAAFTPEDEAKIKAHFAAHKSGAAMASDAARDALSVQISYYEQLQTIVTSGEKTAQSALKAQHDAKLISDEDYYARELDLALNANTDLQALTELELESVQRSALSSSDKLKGVEKYNGELTKLKAEEIAIHQHADNEILVSRAKTAAEIAKQLEVYAASEQKAIESSYAEVDAAQAAYDAHDKLKSVIEAEALARLELARDIIAGTEDTSVLNAQIANKKRLIDILKNGELRDVNEKAAKDAADVWQKTSDSIRDNITDAFLGATDNGKSAFENLRDAVEKMFKDMVLRPIIQAGVSTALDSVGLGSSASGIMGMANTGSSLYSTGSKAYDWVSGLFPTTPSVASETATVAALNDWFGVSALSGSSGSAALGISTASTLETGGVLGSGAWGAGTETLAGTLGTGVFDTGIAAAAPTLAAPAVEAAVGAAATEGILGSIGTAISAIPVWGWAIAGIGALLAMGNDSIPSYNTGDSNLTFNPDGTVKTASTEHGDSVSSLSYAAGLQGSYAAAIESLGATMAETNFVTGSNSGKEASDPQVVFASSVNGQSYQSAETQAADTAAVELAASRAVFSAIQASEMPKYLAGAFDGIVASTATQEQITAALEGATALKSFHDQLQLLPWESLKNMTYATSQALVDMSGSLDALQTNLGTFYDNFYTDSAKTALLTTNTTAAFAGLGITMPAVDENMRDWYRTLVESVLALDQSDAANAGATVAVLALQGAVDALAPAFADTTSAADAAASAVDEAAAALQKLSDDASSAFSVLEKSVAAAKSAAQMTVDLAAEQVNSITSVFDAIGDNAKQLYGTIGSTSAQSATAATAFIAQALAVAKSSGYLPDPSSLSEAIGAARGGLDTSNFATKWEYDAATLELAGQLDQLKTISGDQLDAAESAQKTAQSSLKDLDSILSTAQAQLDAALGTTVAVMSVNDAVLELAKAVASMGSGGGQSVSISSSSGTAAVEAAQRMDNIGSYALSTFDGSAASLQTIAATAAQYGVSQAEIAAATGYAAEDITRLFSDAGIPKFAAGGYHSGGMALVGESGPELVNFGQPAQIYTAGQTQSMLGGNTARLESLVEALTGEVQRLQLIVDTGNGFASRTSKAVEGNQTRPILVEIA